MSSFLRPMWWSSSSFTIAAMTTTHTSSVRSSGPTEAVSWNRWRYWVPTSLLCLVFVVSAALSLLDPETTRRTTTDLGFPAFIGTYPLAFAKLAAVLVIVWRRWPTLRLFAFAGLLYDMVLAPLADGRRFERPVTITRHQRTGRSILCPGGRRNHVGPRSRQASAAPVNQCLGPIDCGGWKLRRLAEQPAAASSSHRRPTFRTRTSASVSSGCRPFWWVW